MPETPAKKTTAQRLHSAADASGDLLEICIMFAIVVVLGGAFWEWEGRATLEFLGPESITVDPARAGEVTQVILPLRPTRSCSLHAGNTTRIIRQGGRVIEEAARGGVPNFGPVGEWNYDFTFPTPIPDDLLPGSATVTWVSVWDCGLREVRSASPAAKFEVLPPPE